MIADHLPYGLVVQARRHIKASRRHHAVEQPKTVGRHPRWRVELLAVTPSVIQEDRPHEPRDGREVARESRHTPAATKPAQAIGRGGLLRVDVVEIAVVLEAGFVPRKVWLISTC